MRSTFLLLAAVVFEASVASDSLHVIPIHAQTQPSAGLTGLVTAAADGPLEGVLVSARRAGSTITTTVVSNREGRYRFPRSRLEAGQYSLRIRATGYELDAITVDVAAGKETTADLKLQRARDLAAQLSNAEWLASFPGTEAQKASVRPCTHCHTLERIARSRYDADRMVAVIERMATYPQLSFPLKVQKLPAPRIGRRNGAIHSSCCPGRPARQRR